MKISNFSKTVHTIFTKFCTTNLHPKGPLRVQRHQNCKAGMWETQPKLAQKWPKNSHFSTFFAFLKNCPYDSNEIFYSHSTPYYGPLCAISSNSYGWDVRNIAKFSLKMAKKTVIFRFFWFSHKLSIRFERNFLQLFYTILESYMCNGIKIVWLGCEKHSQN